MHKPFSAVLVGAVLGFMACAPLQAGLNQLERRECDVKADTHQLVFHTSFWGDAHACIDKRYL